MLNVVRLYPIVFEATFLAVWGKLVDVHSVIDSNEDGGKLSEPPLGMMTQTNGTDVSKQKTVVHPEYDCYINTVYLMRFWSDTRLAWCCTQFSIGCEELNTKRYDCVIRTEQWRMSWSLTKKLWCCKMKGTGCEDGLTVSQAQLPMLEPVLRDAIVASDRAMDVNERLAVAMDSARRDDELIKNVTTTEGKVVGDLQSLSVVVGGLSDSLPNHILQAVFAADSLQRVSMTTINMSVALERLGSEALQASNASRLAAGIALSRFQTGRMNLTRARLLEAVSRAQASLEWAMNLEEDLSNLVREANQYQVLAAKAKEQSQKALDESDKPEAVARNFQNMLSTVDEVMNASKAFSSMLDAANASLMAMHHAEDESAHLLLEVAAERLKPR
eukprot:TRINITY_DN62965_c0_g1_i1.p1 TRINITY_DN62965_c0_g1~~TRINITY_DN62965_c0_g1_i1.p1  ORF type:complete len:387 (-),score=72.92 TRINITY_DN62965_c0_g1_i1:68-1228(-)